MKKREVFFSRENRGFLVEKTFPDFFMWLDIFLCFFLEVMYWRDQALYVVGSLFKFIYSTTVYLNGIRHLGLSITF